MFRTLHTSEIEVGGQRYPVQYFEHQTIRGTLRFSCEVSLGPADRIILDDDSLPGLESKIQRLVPATIASRILASRPPFAA